MLRRNRLEVRMMWLWVMLVVVVGNVGYGCLEQERIALLQLKAYINHPNGDSLPTWEDALVGESTTNCCEWERVKCNTKTGRVIQLSLNYTRNFELGDWYLNVSMFHPFEELESLDLSGNSLAGWLYNEGFENLVMLEVLDLSDNGFNNSILSTLGGLTSLKSLRLGGNWLNGTICIDDFKLMKNLEELDISHNELDSLTTNSGFERSSALAKLEVLKLNANRLRNGSLLSLGGLSSLKVLSLSDNNFSGTMDVGVTYNMTNLEELDLSGNMISNMKGLKCLSKLKVLDIGGNELQGLFPGNGLDGLKLLRELYLDYSHIDNSVLYTIGVLPSLRVLSLRSNGLNGRLPDQGWCELSYLRELDLSENDLDGMLPSCLGNLTSIRLLDLSLNQFNGNLALSALSDLTTLEYLFLSHNNFEIPFSFVSFFNHSKLKVLVGDGNKLIDQIDAFQTWIPRFQLQVFSVAKCGGSNNLHMKLAYFLYYQYDLRIVDLSGNGLLGKLPVWLLENNTRLEVLNVRNNSLIGPFLLPSHPNPHAFSIGISDNHFDGQVPKNIGLIFPNLLELYMSRNLFEGHIPTSLGDLDSLRILDFSNNNFSGQVPEHLAGCICLELFKISHNDLDGQISPSFSNLTKLAFLYMDKNHFVGNIPDSLSSLGLKALDVSNNHMTGKLPRSIQNMSSLLAISMFSNHFSGPIPMEFCKLSSLQFLDLSENYLSGSIPSCFNKSSLVHIHLSQNRLRGPITHAFSNSSSLVTLDLSANTLTGTLLPDWIGSLFVLSILLLKSNHFDGEIPVSICKLKWLSILDLSQNNLSGPIPPCLCNLPFETNNDKSSVGYSVWLFAPFDSLWHFVNGANSLRDHADMSRDRYRYFDVQQQVMFTTKHRSYSYKGSILDYMSGVDLSCNHLSGEIPPGIGNLSNIRALNLSHNNLTRSIPAAFSLLKNIESLDLSCNNLNGRIPPQLIEMNSLAVFSVAHNNLSGATPDQKAQFATFEESSYEGNPLLCGPPLHNSCPETVPASTMQDDLTEEGEDKGFIDMDAFYVSFLVSYIIILLVTVAVLFINPDWRRAWFQIVEVCMTSSYFFVSDNVMKLLNRRSV